MSILGKLAFGAATAIAIYEAKTRTKASIGKKPAADAAEPTPASPKAKAKAKARPKSRKPATRRKTKRARAA